MINNPLLSDAVVEAVAKMTTPSAFEADELTLGNALHSAQCYAGATLEALTAAGYAVVPVEPTLDMIVAGTEDWMKIRATEDRAEAIWKAMLSAAWVDGWGWRAPVRDREPTPRYVMPLPQPPKEPGQ